jgi:cell division protein ZipA
MQAGDEIPAAPPPYQPVIERLRAPRRPPLVEISEDDEVDISAYVGKDRRRLPEPPPIDMSAIGAAPEDSDETAGATRPEADEDHHSPWVQTHPLERSKIVPKSEMEPDEPKSIDPFQQHAAEASKQRIVALRLVASGIDWDGKQLREAIEAEGMHYGRYSIFHREREDGKTIFYVASMMEPGSFDLAKMDDQLFPGISLFGIVPGPLDGPATFDLVLAAGRHLAERLKGQLQDEQGSTLTAQRILNLREELVHFEHRNKRLRRN